MPSAALSSDRHNSLHKLTDSEEVKLWFWTQDISTTIQSTSVRLLKGTAADGVVDKRTDIQQNPAATDHTERFMFRKPTTELYSH